MDRGDPAEQAEFVAEVQAQNRLSSVTFADDYPVEKHSWVEFPVYGTKYEVNTSCPLQTISSTTPAAAADVSRTNLARASERGAGLLAEVQQLPWIGASFSIEAVPLIYIGVSTSARAIAVMLLLTLLILRERLRGPPLHLLFTRTLTHTHTGASDLPQQQKNTLLPTHLRAPKFPFRPSFLTTNFP